MGSVRIGGTERYPFAVLVVGGAPLLSVLVERTHWGAVAAITTLAVVMVALPLRGKTVVRRALDWGSYRLHRTARARTLIDAPEARDIEVAAGICGIRSAGSRLVAMIELAPDLDLPTIIGDRTVYTEDTVPMETLVPLLEHYGIAVEIDIVTLGRRARPAGDYSKVYDQLIGSKPVVGDRMTWLVVRLDLHANLTALTRRGPCEVSGPRALATAAHRIATRLRERALAAEVLPGAALEQATRLLEAGIDPHDLSERWQRLDTTNPGRCATSFALDWSQVDTAGLDDCWRWNRGWTTLVIALGGPGNGSRGLVRFVGPEVDKDLPSYLRKLPGRQSLAFRATLPGAHSIREVPGVEFGHDLPSAQLSAVELAIGPNGQILGALTVQDRHALALPLFDSARYHPRKRTIDVRAELPVAQQIILRAMVVGADVVVHSDRPHLWWQLAAAVGDPQALRLAGPAEEVEEGAAPGAESPTVEVFDQVVPLGSGAHTILTIAEPGIARRRTADLVIEQVDATTIEVGIPMRTVRVDLLEPRGETRFFESAAGEAAADSAESGVAVPISGAAASVAGE